MRDHDQDHDEALLTSYLLGQMSPEETDRLEERLLTDDSLFELAEAIEWDLLGSYGRGELSPEDGEKVVQRLAASPRGRQRLEMARDLTAIAKESLPSSQPQAVSPFRRPPSRPPVHSRPIVRLAMAASLAGIVVIGASQSFWSLRPAQERVEQVAVSVLAFSPGEIVQRGSGEVPKKASLSPSGLNIVLNGLREEGYPSYEVVVSREEREILREAIKTETEPTVVHLAADVLSEGRYELEVLGLAPQGDSEPVILEGFELTAE